MWEFPLYKIGSEIDWDIIKKKFDWVRDMEDVPQDKIWHAEGDVFIHTTMVCESLIKLPEFIALSDQDKHIIFTAALMHDIEKRSTTTEEFRDGRMCVVAPSHAKRGEFTARQILYKDIETPFEIREQICKLVRYHGIPLWSVYDDDAEQRVIETSTMVRNDLLAMIAKADILGRTCQDAEEQLEKIELFEMLCKDLSCWDKPKEFTSDLARYKYLNEGGWPQIEVYDDKKFDVIVMSALPGTGKDTYVSKNIELPTLSLDDIRRENKIKHSDKKGSGRAIQEGKEKAKEFMRSKQSFVFNATNITSDMRGKWIDLFMEYGGKVKIVYLETPYKTLISQNHNREHKIPEDKINKMINKLEIPSFREAHEVEFIAN